MHPLVLVVCLGVAQAAPIGAQALRAEAERALQRSFAHLLDQHFEASRDEANRALASFERLGDGVAQAVTLELLASSELAQGQKAKAFAAFTEAFARAVRAGDDFAIAALASLAGRLAPEVGRAAEAELLLSQGLEALERVRRGNRWVGWFEFHHAPLGLPFAGVATLNARRRLDDASLAVAEGTLHRQRGHVLTWASAATAEARAELERALERLPADHEERLLAEVDLGALELLTRHPDEAYVRLEKSQAALRHRPSSQATYNGCRLALLLLSGIDDKRGRFTEALAWTEAASSLVEGRGDAAREAEILTNRSRILLHAGREAEAEATLLAARELARKSGDGAATDSVNRAFAMRKLTAGQFEKAAEILARLASDSLERPTCVDRAGALQLAATYGLAQRPREAREIVRRVSALPTDPICPEVAYSVPLFAALSQLDTLEELANLVKLAGSSSGPSLINTQRLEPLTLLDGLIGGRDPRRVLANELEPQLRRAQERRDAAGEILLRILRAEILVTLGDYSAALDDIAWLTESARRANDPATQISAAWLASRIARKQGRTEAAIRHLEEALTLEEALLAGNTLDEFLLAGAGGAALQYETLVELLLDSGRNEEAFAVAERSRSQALVRLLAGGPSSAPTSRGDLDARREVERLRVERRALADRHARGEMEAQSFAAESARLNARYDEATLRLKLTRHREAPGPAPAAPTVTDVRRSLPAETTLVSFFVLPKETIVWVLDAERLTTQRLALGRDELAALVNGFRERIATRRPLPRRGAEAIRSPEAPSAAGDELSARLWSPLVPLVRHRRVILEPHGSLHALPFAALRGPNGRFLVEDFVPSTLPSAATLRFLRVPRPVAPGAPLVVGDPALPPGWKLPRLAGAHAEATRLGERLGTTPLVGTGATETAVRARASAAGLIHIAAHFVRLDGEPRYSHLALGPDAEHDGKLEVHEIFDELELPTTRLVVLSACETALGRRTDGDEIEGAVRGLLDAGSAAVLATHWAIDDEVSATLMDRFYERLLAGEPAAEALRKAQLETLAEHEAPHFWAAFTLAGDPGVSLDP